MKTIEDKAWHYAQTIQIDDYGKEKVEDAFCEGVKFAQRWIPIDEELPISSETGNFDGKRSDFVLIKLSNGNWHKARLYTGIIDGHIFNDFCSEKDYVFSNVTHWRPIELE